MAASFARADESIFLENDFVKVGVDPQKGGSVAWLSCKSYPRNTVNIAVFSPMATEDWNFGPHGHGLSNDPTAGPCMHVAPLVHVALGPRSRFAYGYWIIVGDQQQIAARLDELILKHADEKAELDEVR
jgi:hypothetical protein